MKLLLDTHAFIWWVSAPQQLSPAVLSAFCDPANQMLVSVVSVWEIQIKVQLRKLTIGQGIQQTMQSQLDASLLDLLPLELNHIYALERIPVVRRDPFDRILAAQAISEMATLVTKDPALASYGIKTLW